MVASLVSESDRSEADSIDVCRLDGKLDGTRYDLFERVRGTEAWRLLTSRAGTNVVLENRRKAPHGIPQHRQVPHVKG